MCSCFVIAGGDRLKWTIGVNSLIAQCVLPQETGEGVRSAGYRIPWRVCKSGGMLLKFRCLGLFRVGLKPTPVDYLFIVG